VLISLQVYVLTICKYMCANKSASMCANKSASICVLISLQVCVLIVCKYMWLDIHVHTCPMGQYTHET
jgi:hypothetical protein